MQRFYFDHNATTPISPGVLQAMTDCLSSVYGNASSIHHDGQAAKKRLEEARRQVASWLRCDAREVVFTAGGTESDNLAILGVVRAGKRAVRHVITSAIEHPAVLSTGAALEREGVLLTYVPVDGRGLVDPDDVRKALRPETVLISIMHANNETGVVQPVEEIAVIARDAGVPMHSDGVQAAGKLPVNMRTLGIDLYSVSAHKIYGPKGTGVLFVRRGTAIEKIHFGGHHERDRRPGTENVPAAAAFGVAAAEAEARVSDTAALRDRLENLVAENIPNTFVNGGAAPRVQNTSNICFEGIDGEALVIALDLRGFSVSTGSACSSGAVEPSHVLMAMGLDPADARASIRFSLGASNTAEQVDSLATALVDAVGFLRRLSPVSQAHA